jgi:predicted SAM-dependent methyltransferase
MVLLVRLILCINLGLMQKKVLNVGCGYNWKENLHDYFHENSWLQVRLDIDPVVEPDLIMNMTDLSSIKSGSFDAVFSCHNLEHLETHEVLDTLIGFYRVLNFDGFALIIVPNLQQAAQFVVEDKLFDTVLNTSAGPVSPIDIIFGYRPLLAQGNKYMAHRTGFTATTLGGFLLQAGFSVVKVRSGDALDLTCVAYKNNLITEDPLLF